MFFKMLAAVNQTQNELAAMKSDGVITREELRAFAHSRVDNIFDTIPESYSIAVAALKKMEVINGNPK